MPARSQIDFRNARRRWAPQDFQQLFKPGADGADLAQVLGHPRQQSPTDDNGSPQYQAVIAGLGILPHELD